MSTSSTSRGWVIGSAVGLVVAALGACESGRPAGLDGRSVGPGPATDERCSTDGATRECHVETGRHDAVVNCFAGTQACSGGRWGACGGAGTLTTLDRDLVPRGAGGGGLRALALPAPSPDAGACANNSCNPYCWGYDVDAGLSPEAGVITGGAQGGSYFGLPIGWVNDNQVGCHKANVQDCFFGDTCCTEPTQITIPSLNKPLASNCIPWVDPRAATMCQRACNDKPDYTLGVGCHTSDGHLHFPVCNRGGVDATTGALRFGLNSSNDIHNDCASDDRHGKGYCNINLAVLPIAKGTCYDFDLDGPLPAGITCPAALSTPGNVSAYINEKNVLPECAGCNNWSAAQANDSCSGYGGTATLTPLTVTETVTASCPAGAHPVWNQLAWSATLPTGADIKFQAQTAPLASDGGVGALVPATPVTLADPPNGGLPASCPLSGPSPCPVGVATALGAAPTSTNEVMKLTLTLTPSASGAPRLSHYQLTYSCVPAE